MAFELAYYGHAAFAAACDGFNLLVDPFLTGNPQCPVKAEDVPADYILVTHGHGDHLGDTLAIATRTGATVVSVYELCNWLNKKGNVKIHGQHLGGGFHYPFGYLKLTLALHGCAMPDGIYVGNPFGFLLTTLAGKKVYFAGDTGLFGDMRLIGEEGVDLAVLPIGDNFTMGPADALRAVKLLQPRMVIPIHYDTFDLIRQDVTAWAGLVETETSARVKIMNPGDVLTLA